MASGWRRVLLGLACVAAVACRQQVFEPVRDGLVATASVSGEVRVVTKADLLFVVDDSPSMANEQEKLAAGFAALADRLQALDPPVGWRVGVMTTSVDEAFGPCPTGDPSAPGQCSASFGGGPFTCEAGRCVRRFPDRAARLVAAPGNPEVLDVDAMPLADLVTAFGENVRVGLAGSRMEQPLRAVESAIANGNLASFRRPDARLVVVVASDEDDCSDSTGQLMALERTPSGAVDHCDLGARTGDGLDDVTAWVSRFKASGDVALGAIVGLAPGSGDPGMCADPACVANCRSPAGTTACGTSCAGALRPSLCVEECQLQCESFCGSQAPGRRTSAAVRAMSGPLASVCESDYGPVLAQLARVLGIPEEIELPSIPADPRGLFFVIERGGTTISCVDGRDYVLDAAAHPAVVRIDQGKVCRLLPGDAWSIRYIAR